MRASLIAIMFFAAVLLSIGLGRSISRAEPPYFPGAGSEPASAAPPGTHPVIVELFTSEGCSDCPPADRLLTYLERAQPVPGADVIALEEHVDYWNNGGWRDPFSSSDFTERQSDYAHFFRLSSGPYTPQMVVDGSAQFVGSNEGAALAAISKAAQSPEAPVTVTQAPDSNAEARNLQLRIQAGPPPGWHSGGRADVLLAITEEDLSSNVTAGENAGNRVEHSSVVRELRLIGHLDDAGSFTADQKVNLGRSWKRENLRVVVFVQDHSSRVILGASSLPLSSSAEKPAS